MRNLLLTLCLTAGLLARAQVITSTIVEDPKVLQHTRTWTTREKTEYADGENIIRIENIGYNMMQLGYTVRFNTIKHGLILHKFDAAGKEIQTNKLENGERVFGPVHTASREFCNHIYLIYFRYEDKDSMHLYLSEIDKSTLSVVNTRLLWSYHQDNVGIFKMGQSGMEREIFTRISPDSSKLLIAYENPKHELFSCVVDASQNILRKGVCKELPSRGAEVTETFVENSGNSEAVVSESDDDFEAKPLQGLVIETVQGKERYLDLTAGEGHLQNCGLQASKDNRKLYVYGDYAGAIGSDGVWMATLESDRFKLSKPSLIPYPEDYKEKIHKMGFGLKKHGNYGVLPVEYCLVDQALTF